MIEEKVQRWIDFVEEMDTVGRVVIDKATPEEWEQFVAGIKLIATVI